jgi:hypothetical protein
MHIKDHPTHPENIEIQGMSDERPENPINGSLGESTTIYEIY